MEVLGFVSNVGAERAATKNKGPATHRCSYVTLRNFYPSTIPGLMEREWEIYIRTSFAAKIPQYHGGVDLARSKHPALLRHKYNQSLMRDQDSST